MFSLEVGQFCQSRQIAVSAGARTGHAALFGKGRYRAEGDSVVNPAAFGLVVIFLAMGCVLGWHANRAHSAHGDVRATRGRLPGFKRTRMRSGMFALALIAVAMLVVWDMSVHS